MRIQFRVQIPPLPLPVNEETPEIPANTQLSNENVTHVQRDKGRIAWKFLFADALIEAERWTAFSTVNGMSLYESSETYYGILAPLLYVLYGKELQQSFDAQAQAIKLLLEK